MKDYAAFIKTAVRNPLQTGAIAPSSQYLANTMLAKLPVHQAQCVVELGPGTGAFTKVILSRISPQTTFFAIERNPEMVEYLHGEFPQAEIICDTAENVGRHLDSRHLKADFIISGLPLSWLPNDVCANVLTAVYDGLRPGGKFSMFQYIHSAMTPMGQYVQTELKKRFPQVHIAKTLRNLPPALVLTCEK